MQLSLELQSHTALHQSSARVYIKIQPRAFRRVSTDVHQQHENSLSLSVAPTTELKQTNRGPKARRIFKLVVAVFSTVVYHQEFSSSASSRGFSELGEILHPDDLHDANKHTYAYIYIHILSYIYIYIHTVTHCFSSCTLQDSQYCWFRTSRSNTSTCTLYVQTQALFSRNSDYQ